MNNNKIIKTWQTRAGLKAKIIKILLLPFFNVYYCGYCAIEKNHNKYNVDYDEINIDVHGGITYGEIEKDGLFWIGFDCAHFDDNIIKCDLDYCINECESMAEQLNHLTNKPLCIILVL